jgi:hypothetical protein
MDKKRVPYLVSFRALYQMSKDQDSFAEVTFRSVSKLPADIRFALGPANFLPFEAFAERFHALFIIPNGLIVIYLKNTRTKRIASIKLSLKNNWATPRSWQQRIARSGCVDITDAVSSLLLRSKAPGPGTTHAAGVEMDAP